MYICLYRQRQAGFKRGPRQPTRAEPLPTFSIPLSCLCSTAVPPQPPSPFALSGPVATSRWTTRTWTRRTRALIKTPALPSPFYGPRCATS